MRSVSSAEIAAMFDTIAPRYDFLNRLLSLRQDVRWRRALAHAIPHSPKAVYLDVATGTGDLLLTVRQCHPEFSRYLGVDIAPEMLKIAATKARLRYPLVPAKFSLVSGENLDAPAGAIDIISIGFGLRNMVDKRRALAEFRRVLSDRGLLLILEFFPPKDGFLARLFQLYFTRVLPWIGGLFSQRAAYSYLPASVANFYSPEALAELLTELGFKIEKEQSFIFGWCRLIVCRKSP